MGKRARFLLYVVLLLFFPKEIPALNENVPDLCAVILKDGRISIGGESEGEHNDRFYFFKTKREARAYKRKHKIKGRIRRQADGKYAIESKISFIQADEKTADLISNGKENDGVVVSAKVQAPALELGDGKKVKFGPEKIPPLSFWQQVSGKDVPKGGRYNRDGYYLGPAPVGGMPLAGPGGLLKLGNTFSQLVHGLKGTAVKQGVKFVTTDSKKVIKIYRQLRRSGWQLHSDATVSSGVKTLVNPKTGERIMFRKSQSGGYRVYDSIFQPIGGGKNASLFFK